MPHPDLALAYLFTGSVQVSTVVSTVVSVDSSLLDLREDNRRTLVSRHSYHFFLLVHIIQIRDNF